MTYLLDTGVLLRQASKEDRQHENVRSAVRALIGRREELLITLQNVAEFCNVVTRPKASNGLGLPPDEAIRLLVNEIEPVCAILTEVDPVYDILKRLVGKYGVSGKQVHDARLVAMMMAWQVENILTLNVRDFQRYEPEGIHVVTPESLASKH